MYDESGLLVDHHQIGIFVNDVEWHRFGLDVCWRRRRKQNTHNLARHNRLGWTLDCFAASRNMSPANELLQERAGSIFDHSGKEDIQPQSAMLFKDFGLDAVSRVPHAGLSSARVRVVNSD
jgi:hypothetical protein